MQQSLVQMPGKLEGLRVVVSPITTQRQWLGHKIAHVVSMVVRPWSHCAWAINFTGCNPAVILLFPWGATHAYASNLVTRLKM